MTKSTPPTTALHSFPRPPIPRSTYKITPLASQPDDKFTPTELIAYIQHWVESKTEACTVRNW